MPSEVKVRMEEDEEAVVVVSRAAFAAAGVPLTRPADAENSHRIAAATSLQPSLAAALSHFEPRPGGRVGAVRNVESLSSSPRVTVPRPLLEDVSSSTTDDGDKSVRVVTALEKASKLLDGARMFDSYKSADGSGLEGEMRGDDDVGGLRRKEFEQEAKKEMMKAEDVRRKNEERLFKGIIRRPPRGRQAEPAAAAAVRPAEVAFPGEATSIGMIPRVGATGKDLLRKGYYTYSCLGRAKDAAPIFLEALETLEDATGPQAAQLRATTIYYYARCLSEQGNGEVDDATSIAMAMDALNRVVEQHGGHAAARTLLAELHMRAFPGDVGGAMDTVRQALAAYPFMPEAVVLKVRLENLSAS